MKLEGLCSQAEDVGRTSTQYQRCRCQVKVLAVL